MQKVWWEALYTCQPHGRWIGEYIYNCVWVNSPVGQPAVWEGYFTIFLCFRDLFGLPHIEISGMSLSQSIEAPLTNKDTAILSGGFMETVKYCIFQSWRCYLFPQIHFEKLSCILDARVMSLIGLCLTLEKAFCNQTVIWAVNEPRNNCILIFCINERVKE